MTDTPPTIPGDTRATAVAKALLAAVLVCAFLMALKPVRSPDVWHHVKSGWWVIHHHGPADVDDFSCTAQGQPWLQYEWLSQVTMFLIWHVGGWPALLVGRAVGIALAAGLLFKACTARRAAAPIAAAAVALTFCCMSGRFFSRPEVFSWIWLAGILLAVERLRLGGRGLFFVPALLMVPWVNMHGAWPAGLAWVGLIGGGETLSALARRPGALPRRTLAALWLAFALMLPATLLNPYGFHIWEVPFKLAGLSRVHEVIAEWHRPDWAHWLDVRNIGLAALLLGLLALPRRVRLPDALVILFFGYLALTAKRHLAIAALVSAPILAAQWTALAEAAARSRRLAALGRPRPALLLALLGCLLATWLALGWRLERAGFRLDRMKYPVMAAQFLKARHLDGNVFNSYAYGNYLLFARYPANRVFIDGRVDMYGLAPLALYDRVRQAEEGWPEVLRAHHVTLCVLDTTSPNEKRLFPALQASPDWALVYWDDHAAVYAQRLPSRAWLFKSLYVYSVRPDEFDESVLATRERCQRAEQDYRMALTQSPECVPALYGLARCQGARGAADEALETLGRAVAIDPRAPTPHYARGLFLLQANRLDEARAEYEAAVRCGGHLAESHLALSVIAFNQERWSDAIGQCRRALTYAPTNWKIHWNLSRALERAGDLAGALAAAQTVQQLQPELALARERIQYLQQLMKGEGSPR